MNNEFSFLDLIPSGKFHSCIITGYNLEFYYYEFLIRPKLASLGIVNTLLLIDAHQLDEKLGLIGGAVFASKRAHSISGINSRGSFHSKMAIFSGQEEGFLVIGSGNPTSGGYGSNIELWGAFHVEGVNSRHFPLFRHSLDYIHEFKPFIKGFAEEKLTWMEEFSSWIKSKSLDSIPSVVVLTDGIECRLLSTQKQGLMQTLHELIGQTNVTAITIAAPFFDNNLSVIHDFFTLFPNSIITIILQPSNVAFPLEVPESIKSKLRFIDLDHIVENEHKQYLHAKLIIFHSSDAEYCLMGSANPTRAAFGTLDKKAINNEVCIFLKRHNGSWLEELGLKKTTDYISFDSIKDKLTEPEHYIFGGKAYEIFIAAAEIDEDNLLLYASDAERAITNILTLFDQWGEKLTDLMITDDSRTTSDAICLKPEDINIMKRSTFVQLFSAKDNQAISNKALVQNRIELLKSNPDPKQRKLNIIFSEIEAGQRHLLDIFQYLDSEEVFKDSFSERPGSSNEPHSESQIMSISNSTQQQSHEEFTRSDEEKNRANKLKQMIKYSNVMQVIEFLNNYLNAINQKAELDTANEDEQEDTIDSSEGKEEGDETQNKKDFDKTLFDQFQSRMFRFFNKTINDLEAKIEGSPIDDAGLAFMAATIQLLFYTAGLELEVEEKNKIRSKKVFLVISGEVGQAKSFVDLFVQIIGKLLLCLSQRNQKTQGIDQKITKEIEHILFWHIVFCISLIKKLQISSHILKSKYPHLDDWLWTLFLSTFRYFEKKTLDRTESENEFSKRIKTLSINHDFPLEDLVEITEKYWDEYVKFSLDNVIQSIDKKEKVYWIQQNIFCVIEYYRPSNNGTAVRIAHPGYKFNKKSKNYYFDDIRVLPYARFSN